MAKEFLQHEHNNQVIEDDNQLKQLMYNNLVKKGYKKLHEEKQSITTIIIIMKILKILKTIKLKKNFN